ncbi:hypothetical protein CBR_g46659 [Chara braunii]|uniref:Uncharacterized protein n=1 Tax=Chara braunii TaxID=69332 RepID=A0A388M0V7_CHABU|nr:hypothetical protein CBR_g46659 [Chara braunii]|eukprot:GBG88171.1 hypothetical protein CBR_g46659 [Chara braunii]
MAGSQLSPLTPRGRELLELQQVERIRERLERELKQATDRENEIKRRAARLDTLEADKAALEGLDETTMSDQLKVLKNSMLSLHAHVDSRLDFMQNSLVQILDLLQRPGFRRAAQSPLPLTAMSGPFPVQAGTQPSGTSAAVSQTVASSSSGSAMVATPPQQPVPQQGQQQGQWYPKTPMKPPLAFSGEKKDEELNTWLRTVSVWVKAKRTLQEEEVITAASYLEDWSDECEAAFKRLKHALMNHEVLMVPDPQKPFIVTTDASQYGIGTVLTQQDGKKLRPIEYMSKKMPSKKLAKSTYEKELHALYKALVHWRHFLLGRFFYLRTDHQTLKWIKTQPTLSDALKRWIEVIDQYDFKLEYLKGEYNKVANALSRRADYLGTLVSEFGVSQEVTQSLVGAYQEDPVMMDIMRKLQAKDKATESEFVMVDGLLFLDKARCKRLVVPSSESLRSLFLGECHGATGHFGYKKTSVNLVQRFWWPGMLDDAKKYVETYQVCQRDKPPLGLLKPLPIPAGPEQSVSMDFMDTLVTRKSGKRHIFVIIDRFTKYARLIAMPETARTDHVIKLFMDNWAMPNKNKLKENQEEIHRIAVKLRDNANLVCKTLKDNPNVTDNMGKIAQERSNLQSLLLKTIHELEEEPGKFPSLIATINDEEERVRKFEQTIERERMLAAAVRALRQQIKDEKTAHDEEVIQRGKRLCQLKEDLKHLKQKTGLEARYRAKEIAAAANCTNRVRSSYLKNLDEQIDHLTDLLEMEVRVHNDTMEFLKRKNSVLKEEAVKWANKHEVDHLMMEKRIENLLENKLQDLQLLAELEGRYKKEQEEKAAREAEERRLEELRILNQGWIEVSTRAATKIQKVFRGWRVRHEIFLKKKKKKKKKKKGKRRGGGFLPPRTPRSKGKTPKTAGSEKSQKSTKSPKPGSAAGSRIGTAGSSKVVESRAMTPSSAGTRKK